MPYSAPNLDEVTKAIIRAVAPQRVLDIGCGAGKYGEILRAMFPAAELIGVEVEKSYIERFKLDLVYDDVRLMNATDLITTDIEATYDLVIIGDCIEHLRKSAGLDLLNFLTYRCGYAMVLCPECFPQNAHDGVNSEAHISVWSERDFEWHDLWATTYVTNMMLFLLRGYLKAPLKLRDLVAGINELQLPLHNDSGKFIKNCQLELRANLRTEQVGENRVIYRHT